MWSLQALCNALVPTYQLPCLAESKHKRDYSIRSQSQKFCPLASTCSSVTGQKSLVRTRRSIYREPSDLSQQYQPTEMKTSTPQLLLSLRAVSGLTIA